MAIGKRNSCTSVLPSTCAWEQQEDNETEEQGKKRRMDVERSTEDTKKISPVQSLCRVLSTIIINIILKYFIRNGKIKIKFN